MSGLGLERPVRAFVALPCPAGLRSAVADAIARARGLGGDVSWADPSAAHLTLRFLGTASPSALDRLHGLLPRIASSVPAIAAAPAATGAFPGWRRPRVLWLGVESGGAIERLAARVEAAARQAGFEAEERRFTPHVTLGRVRGSCGADQAAAALRTWSGSGAPEPIPELVLFRSDLQARGARHVSLARYPIG